MANVNIKFNGKDFLLSCDDGQEEHLEELASHLGDKFDKLKSDLGNIGENKLLLITSIKIMDEYFETKKKVDINKKEIENITEKFKQLKALAYDYKDDKENEAKKLSDDISNLENEIQNLKNEYDKIISNTTQQIEEFVQKTNLENQFFVVKKSQIRKIVLKKRDLFNIKNKKINCQNLLKLLNQKSVNKKIGLYFPIGSEVCTIGLIENLRKGKYIISLPVIDKNFEMSFYEWAKNSPLNINKYGIPEPLRSKKIIPSTLIIPLLAFDINLNRLGYGGGFYDRFINKLEKSKKILKIGLALSCQKINKVPTDKFDKKMNYIFTESKIYK